MRLVESLICISFLFFFLEFHCFFFFLKKIKKLFLLYWFAFFLALERPNHFCCMLVMIPAQQQQQFECVIWGFGVLLGGKARGLVATTRSEASRSSELKAEIWCGETQVHMGSADLPFLLLVIQSVKAVVDHSLSLKSPTHIGWGPLIFTSPVRNLGGRRHHTSTRKQ